MGAARDGPHGQPAVARDVLEAGGAAAGPVHGGQLSLRGVCILGRHRACQSKERCTRVMHGRNRMTMSVERDRGLY